MMFAIALSVALCVVVLTLAMTAGLVPRRAATVAGTCLVGVLAVAQPAVAHAADVRHGGRVEVGADEVVDDTLIVFGESVVIAGKVTGDAILFAQHVTVSGVIEGNLVTGAESVDIDGTIQGSTMAAGQNVSVGGILGRQLYAAGETVNLEGGAELSGDALVGGAGVDVASNVGRDVYVGGERVNVSGSMKRDLVMGGSDLRIAGTASVGRNVRAHVADRSDLTVESGAMIGRSTDVEIDPDAGESRFAQAGFYLWRLAMILGGIIFGMLVYLLVPGLFRTPSMKQLPRAAGLGLVGLVAIPMAAVAAAMLVVGIPVAMAAMGAYALALYVGSLVVSAMIGHELLRRRQYRPADIGWSLALGLLLFAVVFELPYVGGVLAFLVAVFGLGMVLDYVLVSLRTRNHPPSP